MIRLVDADALYNGSMKKEYFSFVEHDNHGRESFAYSCAMQRLVEAPTIDAIPVEWLKSKRKYASEGDSLDVGIAEVLDMWEKEQEVR